MGPSTRPPGSEPEDHITVTTVYLDTDYLVDQVFWQHAGLLQDRLDAQELVDTIYTEPAQALRLGEDRTGMLMPWLDELVALSIDGGFGAHFYRMQALWFAIIDVVAPFIRVSQVRLSPTQRARTRPTLPRDRRFAPMRNEAVQARDALHGAITDHPQVGGVRDATRSVLSPRSRFSSPKPASQGLGCGAGRDGAGTGRDGAGTAETPRHPAHATQVVAIGRTSSRAAGIGCPHTTQMP